MRIVDVRVETSSIASSIANASIDFTGMTTSVVAVVTDAVRDGERVVGFGFGSNGRYAQTGLLRDRFVPRLLEAPPETLHGDDGENLDPARIWDILMRNEKPGGHGERSVAIGVLEMALWDATAKAAGLPLYALVADRFGDGTFDERVAVYAAGGYYQPGKAIDALLDEMRDYLAAGYRMVKLKIGGAPLKEDLRRIEAVIDLVGDTAHVAVDANGRFDLAQALAYARAMEPYGLRWYEEAGDPLDFEIQAEVCRHYDHPMATGENLFSHQDVRNLLRYGGMRPDRDVLQMDPSLGYGLTEYVRMLNVIRTHGWSHRSVHPHGGHQFGLNIAAGLKLGGNESYPRVFRPFGGFADTTPIEDGYVRMPDAPGIGIELKSDLYDVVRGLVAADL